MNLILFLYIASFFSLSLGEFGQYPFGSDFSISLTDILLGLNTTAVLIWNIGIRKNLKLPGSFILLILFWATLILSLFFSLNLSGWLYLLRFIIYSSSFYITYSLIRDRILNLHEFLSLLKITSVAVAIIGLIQILVFPDLEPLSYLGYDPHKNRVFSTFLDPNFFGTFLSFAFCIFIYELISKKFDNIKIFLKENKWQFISIFILGLSILLTLSRSSYLVVAVSVGLILLIKNLKLLGVFAILTLILYLIFPAFNSRIEGALNIDKSASERFFSWDKGLLIFQYNPILGIGFNNLRDYSVQNDLLRVYTIDGGNSGAGIDSSLIFILATSGLIGFLSFMIFLIKVIINLVSSLTANSSSFYTLKLEPFKFMKKVYEIPGLSKWYKDKTSSNIKFTYLTLPLLSLTLGLLTGSFFVNSLFYPQIMFIWYSLLGVFYGLGEDKTPDSDLLQS